MPTTPDGQAWLIKRMQQLGYCAYESGVCFGVAHIAKQYILANKLDIFDQLMQKINEIPPHEFVEKIEKELNNPALGGLFQVDSFSGIYNEEELLRYFDSLLNALTKTPITKPISLELSSSNHSIILATARITSHKEIVAMLVKPLSTAVTRLSPF
ncbi:MAG: hypothetical protein WAW86_05705 [Gammaproteobacteria bacterium]